MSDRFSGIAALMAQAQPGHSLPGALYTGQDAFAFDTQVMLKSVWLYACTVAHVKQPGDWHLFSLGNNSVIILRGKDGLVRAFHNSCRHRGARLCDEPDGHARRIVCPYHQWTYGLDGSLIGARHMPAGFDKGDHGLIPVRIENVGGLLFLCLGDDPPPIDRVKADIEAQIGAYDLDHCKVAASVDLVEDANWKLVIENNRECYHCEPSHPELLGCLGSNGFGRGMEGDGDGGDADFLSRLAAKRADWLALGIDHDLIEFPDDWWHRLARLPLASGAYSHTIDGKVASSRLLAPFTAPEDSSLSIWTQPNSWHHFCCDHIVTFSVRPIAADRTLVRTSWLVREDAEEGVDYDPAHLTAVWTATNLQDRRLAELNHAGILSDGYRPGPYSTEERLVECFKDFYLSRGRAALAKVGDA
jgi:Rieske 2Fe-2S family protein